jgi:hypothetical protein
MLVKDWVKGGEEVPTPIYLSLYQCVLVLLKLSEG